MDARKDAVGLVGAGRMGSAMGLQVLRAGFDLHVYDRRKEATESLSAHGAVIEISPGDVAKKAQTIIVMVGYPRDVEDVFLAKDGLLSSAAPGTVIAVASTSSPQQMCMLAELAQAKGIDVLDTPVSRGEPAADAGTLLWFVGGSASALERARPALSTCGSDIYHLGDVGVGQVAKAINNMLMWAAFCSNKEAFSLAEAFNVDEARLREALLQASGASWAMAHWDMFRRLTWAHKDMTIATEMADKAGLPLPLAGLLREQLKVDWQRNDVFIEAMQKERH